MQAPTCLADYEPRPNHAGSAERTLQRAMGLLIIQ